MRIGKIEENILKRSVLGQIHTRREEVLNGAGIGEDCAIFGFQKEQAVVSCVQEDAVTASSSVCGWLSPEGMEGIQAVPEQEPWAVPMRHLIYRCANHLSARGADPAAVMITLLLPKTATEACVKELMKDADLACGELGMQIAGGQCSVSSGIRTPHAVITGYGGVSGKVSSTLQAAAPGQDIVLSKWVGLEGTALLVRQNREQLLSRYPAYLVEEAGSFEKFLSVIPEAATAGKSGACAMLAVSEGGIFAALRELAEGAGVGLTVDLKKLPIRQETVEVCECLGVNPYELRSEGCLLMTTGDGMGLLAALEEKGIPAAVVGKLTDSRDRVLLNDGEVRYLDRPGQDALYQFYEK